MDLKVKSLNGKTVKERNNIIYNRSDINSDNRFDAMPDDEFQSYMLDGVSRTFALTIPQLPDKLEKVVANAYLLCRTVDTIEDDPALSYQKKRELCSVYNEVLEGNTAADYFTNQLTPLLSDSTLDTEKELIKNTRRVIDISHSFSKADQRALRRCVNIMGEGMAFYQENASIKGLENMAGMDRYCYYVAGVVGEMLTELFSNYSDEIAENKEQMMGLAVSFGQGLQMTNILKDIWDDAKRDVCWLPRSIFEKHGFNLDNLKEGPDYPAFQQGVLELVGIANYHLHNAFAYTLLIPPGEAGIRKFCLWAIGMAVLTLRKIYKNPGFKEGDEVKITRNTVKAVVAGSNLASGHDRLLKAMFKSIQVGLPTNK